jgi:hypothetical protein
VPGHLTLGEGKIKKKDRGLPRVPGHLALGEEVKKNEFLPRVLHSGKSKKNPVDGVKSSPSATVALGEAFPQCTIFGTRGKALPRKLFPECLRHPGKQVAPVANDP